MSCALERKIAKRYFSFLLTKVNECEVNVKFCIMVVFEGGSKKSIRQYVNNNFQTLRRNKFKAYLKSKSKIINHYYTNLKSYFRPHREEDIF